MGVMGRPVPELPVFAEALLRDRRCLVTGGGTGIGLAVARLFVQMGARVALLGRREEVLDAAATALDPSGERVCIASADIREPEQVGVAVASILETLGGIDVLVNNAGGQFAAPAEAISPNGFAAIVRNNLLGTWNVTHAVATKALIPGGGGVICNVIANIARGFPGMVHTGAARAGVENMTRTLAIEWMRHGIRVNAVAPGIIETDALSQYPDGMVDAARKMLPCKRLGTPEEAARPIAFLCSDAASYVTGVTLYVDGGARLWGETWPLDDPYAGEDS